MEQNERRDIEIWGAWGQIMALEVALIALLKSHPDPDALHRAWLDAEDTGFMQTSDIDPRVYAGQLRHVRDAYVSTLARLRDAVTAP